MIHIYDQEGDALTNDLEQQDSCKTYILGRETAGKDVKRMSSFLYVIDGKVDGHNHYGKQHGESSES